MSGIRLGIRLGILALAALAVSACGGGKKDEPAATGAGDAAPASASGAAVGPAPARAAAAPAAFAQCAACHSLQAGKNGIGPSLFGVFGAKAGSSAGYSFSGPLKASGLTWDEATLDTWLTAPMQTVPGTKMTFGGIKDPAKRAELVAFLKTLK